MELVLCYINVREKVVFDDDMRTVLEVGLVSQAPDVRLPFTEEEG